MSEAIPAALSWLLASHQCERAGLQNLLQTGQLTEEISQLIHQLQRERGASNIWICSRGQLFGDELPARERQVSQALKSVLAHLPPLPRGDNTFAGNRRLFSRIAAALHALGDLAALREGVRGFQISHADAMEHFNHIIRQLMSLVFEMTDTASDPQVSRALIAMFSFMQGKELAGQERATGSAGYATGEFSVEQGERMVTLIDAQERCFSSFAQFADARSLQKWRTVSTSENEVERLRRIACTRSKPDAQGTEMALRWYQLMTRRIDGLKTIEDSLAQQLIQRCRESLRLAAMEAGEVDIQQAIAQWNNEPTCSLYVVGRDWLKQQGESLDTGGLMPDLSRSVLGMVQEQSQRLQAQDNELAAMRASLNERKLIDQAKALLIRHHNYSEEKAWQTLRKMAMDQNRRMVDIASALLSVAAVFPATPK